MKLKALYLVETLKAFAVTDRVLRHFDQQPECSDEFDFKPSIEALLDVCRDFRRDSTGIEYLRQIVAVFDGGCASFIGASEEQLRTGLACIGTYTSWLAKTFPDVRKSSTRN